MEIRNLFSYFLALSVLQTASHLSTIIFVFLSIQKLYLIPSCPPEKILYMIVQGKSCVFVSLLRMEIWCYGYLWKQIIFLPPSYEDAHNYRLQTSSSSMTLWSCKAFWFFCSKISNLIFNCLKVNGWIIEIRKVLCSYRTKIFAYE